MKNSLKSQFLKFEKLWHIEEEEQQDADVYQDVGRTERAVDEAMASTDLGRAEQGED